MSTLPRLTLILASGLILSACAPASIPTPKTTGSPVVSPLNQATEAGGLTKRIYSFDAVATHRTPADCWLVIDGKVYNVSNFGENHPGGKAVYTGCGQDATTLFNTRPMGSGTPHSDNARSLLPNFYLGDLAQ